MLPEAAMNVYAGLFAAAFLAATIFPAQSELLLTVLLVSGNYPAGVLLFVATLGNVLGSVLNWTLGRYFAHFQGARWFPVSAGAMAKAEQRFARFGPWVLLLSWVPIIGDPLTVLAGILRMRLTAFVAIVALAKFGRYAVLSASVLGLIA